MSDLVPDDSAPDPWQIRASDADREAYVSVLQQAYMEGRLSKSEYDDRMGSAYQAVTYADLAPLLRDLPVSRGQVPGPPVPQPAQRPHSAVPLDLTTSGSAAPLIALFSEVSKDSRWTLPDGQVAVAVFGSVKLDLRAALLTQRVTELRANAFFGSVEIIVPGDIEVQVNGFGALGEYKRTDQRTVVELPSGGPVVNVSGLALFGSVEVKVVDAPVTGIDRLVGGDGPGPAIGR